MRIASYNFPYMSESIFRSNGRAADHLRVTKLTPHYVAMPEGSVLMESGHTRVLCNATIELGVPGWLRGSGRGWITAEYGMLPRATRGFTVHWPEAALSRIAKQVGQKDLL